eukprot:11133290-Ditylum_brightwellii.AAC.1
MKHNHTLVMKTTMEEKEEESTGSNLLDGRCYSIGVCIQQYMGSILVFCVPRPGDLSKSWASNHLAFCLCHLLEFLQSTEALR